MSDYWRGVWVIAVMNFIQNIFAKENDYIFALSLNKTDNQSLEMLRKVGGQRRDYDPGAYLELL